MRKPYLSLLAAMAIGLGPVVVDVAAIGALEGCSDPKTAANVEAAIFTAADIACMVENVMNPPPAIVTTCKLVPALEPAVRDFTNLFTAKAMREFGTTSSDAGAQQKRLAPCAR